MRIRLRIIIIVLVVVNECVRACCWRWDTFARRATIAFRKLVVCGGRRCTCSLIFRDADARFTTVLTMACIGPIRGKLCARIQEKLCQWGQTVIHTKKKSYLCSKYGDAQQYSVFNTQVSTKLFVFFSFHIKNLKIIKIQLYKNLNIKLEFHWRFTYVRSCA